MSPTLVVEKPGFQAASFGNYPVLGKFIIACLLVSLEILLIENIWFVWVTSPSQMKLIQRQVRQIKVY